MRSILRQIVAVLALVGIVTTMVPSTFAVSYTAQAAADKLAASSFIVDQSATPAAYRLADNLLRQEAVGTAANVLGILDVPVSEYVCQNKFGDVSAASGWVCRAAELAAAAGLTNAANANFRPKDNLTRFEALVFALRAADLVPAGNLTQAELIELGADAGLISSSAGFNSNAAATRGEFFQYVVRGLDAAETPELCDILGICPGDGDPTPTTGGAVSVALASNTPVSGVIVAGQATAPMLAFKTSGGVLATVVLKRTGISDQNTLSNVYLYDGAARLTDGYSFNSNGEITINGLAVPAGKTIWVLADVYSAAPSGQTIALSVTGVKAVGESTIAQVTGVVGNLMSVASGSTLACVGLSGGNTVSAGTVNAGSSSYAVWRQVIQVNTRTLQLKSANFRISGSAPSDALQNIGLYIDGVKTSAAATMTSQNGSNYISFDMMSFPVALTTGSHTVEVRGDIVKGSSYNFTVSLQQASDLMIYDPQVGVNVAISGNTSCSTSFTSSSAGTISIGVGSFTAVLDPVFQTFTNVTGGASNTVIAKFKLHGYGEDVKVTSLPITPVLAGTTPAAAGLQNVTIFFNGAQVGTQQNWTSGALTFNLGSQLIVPAGVDSFLEVRADLRTTAGTNYTAGTVSANLGAATAEGINSKSSITGPTSTGNSLTIQTGLLAVAKNAGYANQSQNPNTAGVKIGSFVLQNQSSSEGIRITSFAVNPVGAGTSLVTNLSGLKTSETSGSGATPQQPSTSNTFSVDFILDPGATKTIDIFADTSSATGVTVIPTLTVTGLGISSNTSVSQGPITGQTITLSSGTVGTPTLTSSSSTQSQYIAAAGGNTDGSKGTFNFVSTGGSSTITELKFTISGTGVTPVTSVRIGSVTAPVVSGVAWLQNLNIAVPNGGSGVSVDAFFSYSDVGTSGEIPGATALATLTYVKYTSGAMSSNFTTSVAANTMTLVGSKPTVAINTTTASGLQFSTPTGIENKVGEITVSADAKGNIKVDEIVFNVSSTNIAGVVLSAPRIADGSTTVSGSACTGTSTVTCDFGTASTADFDGYTITAGTSKSFNLYMTVVGTGQTTSGGYTAISSSVAASTFIWDDASTNGASGTARTGALLYNFPTGSYSIKQ